MNFKTTLILLILLLGAGAYLVFDHLRSRQNPPETASGDSHKLFDLKGKDDVQSLTIKSNDGSEIVLSKSDAGKWRMTKPVEAAAEGWQVDSLVRDLVELNSVAEVDPKDKGLDKPRFNIEISAKGGKLLKFAVGDKNQLGQMYVQVAGKSQADAVDASVYESLAKPANELRDKQLVTVSSSDIKQLAVTNADGQKLVLEKGKDGWAVTEPQKLPGDDSAVLDLLGAVTGLRATDWVAKDAPEVANTGFDKPQMTVSFTTTAPTTQPTSQPTSQPTWTTITFGGYDNIRRQKVYATISDTKAIFKVNSTPLTTLNKKPIELRDKKVLDIQPEQVSKLSIVTDLPAAPAPEVKPGKKTTVEIVRRKQVAQTTPPAAATAPTSKPATTQATTHATSQPATTQAVAAATKPAEPLSVWELKSDPKGEADDDGVKNLLADLHPLRATKFLDGSPTTRPTSTITLKFTTEGPGGTPVTDYDVKLFDPGSEQSVQGTYNGLTFELPRTFLTKLEGNFAKKPKAPSAPDTGDTFKLPGER